MSQEQPVFFDSPHRRYNPLSDEWVLVSPHRTKRPWQGQQETPSGTVLPQYDPKCYLCPGNTRANGQQTPAYEQTYVFDNDFAALLPDAGLQAPSGDPLFQTEPESGVCRVICYNPRHDLSMSLMTPEQVLPVVSVWRDEYASLGARPDIGYVQIFENRGLLMGCSNPHPHGQIWATRSVPDIPAREDRCQADWRQKKGECLLCAYLLRERQQGERIVLQNDSFVALVPFWAVWPFETMVLPRRHTISLMEMTPAEQADLAALLVELTVRYDNLFQTSFPYSMGMHQAPTTGAETGHWHWHMHFFPPLLRSSTVKKFMVGYEMLAMPQRDLTAESAAARLRELPGIHYTRSGV